jgi:hypothetical protein
MENESLGKALPRVLLPYIQEWADRSGYTLLSRILVDEQFHGLVEKYADEVATYMSSSTPRNGNGRRNGKRPSPRSEPRVSEADADDLATLTDRVLALEAQQELQQALFETLQIKIKPLALALGCCSECVVGIDGCPKCGGLSKVGLYTPDYALLEAHIVIPLAARGVPLRLNEKKVSSKRRRSVPTTKSRKERKAWSPK